MQLRTPAKDREWLAVPDFSNVASLVERNRSILGSSSVAIAGLPLSQLRSDAREELLGTGSTPPLIVTGHQPELFHPGVWVKNFAVCGLARRLGGLSVNVIVDSDAVKSAKLAIPTWERWEPRAVRLSPVAFAEHPREQSWESWRIPDESVFVAVLDQLRAKTKNWGYQPLALSAWKVMSGATYADRFQSARIHFEQEWGCSNFEIRTSALSQSRAFQTFAQHLLADRDRFRDVHNKAVRDYRRLHRLRSQTHPVPELVEGEVPFWHIGLEGRERVLGQPDFLRLRPRALTLTLFVRLFLSDWFIHGIGGGKYDTVTDQILREYFGIEAPAFQVLSATLLLPLPHFASTKDDEECWQRRVRDLHWNPHRYLHQGGEEHQELAEASSLNRRQQFRAFRALGDRLRPLVQSQIDDARRQEERVRQEVAANAILGRRDLAWPLYAPDQLRTYLCAMMERAEGTGSIRTFAL